MDIKDLKVGEKWIEDGVEYTVKEKREENGQVILIASIEEK